MVYFWSIYISPFGIPLSFRRVALSILWSFASLPSLSVAAQDHFTWQHLGPFEARNIIADEPQSDGLWIPSNGGVHHYNTADQTWQTYDATQGLATSTALTALSDSLYLWVGTERSGGFRFHRITNEVTSFLQDTSPDPATIYALAADTEFIWAGTQHGLYQLDRVTLEIRAHWTATEGLGESFVLDLYDDGAALWIATSFAGPALHTMPETGGLSRLDKATGTVETFRIPAPASSPANHIQVLYPDQDQLWVGSLDGLFIFDVIAETFSPVTSSLLGQITAIVVDKHYVWCTTLRNGNEVLYQLDKHSHEVVFQELLPLDIRTARLLIHGDSLFLTKGSHFFSAPKDQPTLRSIALPFLPTSRCTAFATYAQSAYAGCGHYLITMQTDPPAITHVHPLLASPLSIRTIHATAQHLWAGTDAGLYLLDRTSLTEITTFLPLERIRWLTIGDTYVWTSSGSRLHVIERQRRTGQTVSFQDHLTALTEPVLSALVLDSTSAWISYEAQVVNNQFASGILHLNRSSLALQTTVELFRGAQRSPITALAQDASYLYVARDSVERLDKATLQSESLIPRRANLLAAENSRLWLSYGTVLEGGLQMYEKDSGQHLQTFEQQDGLSHPFITTLVPEPQARRTWTTTFNGVSVLNWPITLGTARESLHEPSRPAPPLLHVFPNPARTTIHLSYVAPTPGLYHVHIYNTLGQTITSTELTPPIPGQHRYSFDTSHLASGLYFVVLEANNRHYATSFVLQ